MKIQELVLNRSVCKLKSLSPFFLLVLCILVFFPPVLSANDRISVSPLKIGWNNELMQYEAEYTIYNNTYTEQKLAAIVVFEAKDARRWRGTAAVKLEADSDRTFIRNIPAYFLLRNDYLDISVKIYRGNYETFVHKSSLVQKLSSRLVVDDQIRVELTVINLDKDTDQTLSTNQLVLGANENLESLLGSKSQVASVMQRVEGRKPSITVPLGEFRLESGNFLMTVSSNKLSSKTGNQPKEVIIRESAGHLTIKNPEDDRTLTGSLKGDSVYLKSGEGSAFVEFKGELTADNQIRGEAIQKTESGMTYTATFSITKAP